MLNNLKKKLRKTEFFWRYLFNYKSSISYRMAGNNLKPYEKRIIDELKRNGIAKTSVEELQIDPAIYQELLDALQQKEEEHKTEIENARNQGGLTDKVEVKTFLIQLLGMYPEYDASSIYNRLARKYFQSVANGYFEMKDTEIRDYNLWHNVPSSGPLRTSQLWHRDREDLQILKIFLYFSDVDEEAGPFTYAPGTQLQGSIKAEPEFHWENGVKRTTNEQMDKIVPKEKWIVGTGKKGTIVFADTHGYHKGGDVKSKDRIMLNVMFTSPACGRNYFAGKVS